MSNYTVTVVSPTGNRDTYNVDATGPQVARIKVAQMLCQERPQWRAVSVVCNYRIS